MKKEVITLLLISILLVGLVSGKSFLECLPVYQGDCMACEAG